MLTLPKLISLLAQAATTLVCSLLRNFQRVSLTSIFAEGQLLLLLLLSPDLIRTSIAIAQENASPASVRKEAESVSALGRSETHPTSSSPALTGR